MGGKSSIEQLSDELRAKLIELLNKPGITQQEITDAINDAAGETVVSKSAVNRYAMKMREFTERNRQAREVAELYLEQQGEQRQNVLGKMLNEMLRTISFDLIVELPNLQDQDPQEKIALVTSLMSKMSRAMRDLEQAAKINAEREQAIREEALEDAVERVEKSASEIGLPEEKFAIIKRDILGLS